MGPLSCLLTPQSIAVVGANDDPATYGGRLWRYLRRDFPGPLFAVNRRPGALGEEPRAARLQELPTVPELVVLATPAHTVLDLLREAGELGVRAAVILAREALGQEEELRLIAAEHDLVLLGPNCLGLINSNGALPLSSSISLDRGLTPGPLSLVSQSGALMGILHARAIDLGLGLGLCISTGSQAQVRVENALWEIAGIPDIRAVGAYIEDLDVAAFAAAATALHANGKHLIVLKGGVSEAGSRATAAHSRALASHGPALRQLLADSGTIVVDDADELLAALALCEPFARGRVPRLGLVSLSGGLGAVATDCARSLGLPLAPPSSETEQALRDLGMPALTNPLDLEAAPSSSEQKVAAVQALLDDTNLDGVFLLVNDMPGLGGFLDDLSPLAAAAGDPLIVCSACSHQSDDLWRAWTARGHRYFDGSSTTLRALAAFHRRLDRQSEATPEQRGQLPFPAVREALVAASIPFAEAEEVHTVAEAVQVANRLGYPVVLKVARAGHRGQAGVRTLLDSAVAVERAWDELTGRAPLLLQRQAQPGLEFYVGVMNDPTFGRLLLLGRGGRQVENWQDVAVARLPADRDTITRLLDRTVAGGWLRQPASRGIADLAALVDVAERAAGMAADLGARLQSLDLNPVVVHRSGATVVDAKVVLRCEP